MTMTDYKRICGDLSFYSFYLLKERNAALDEDIAEVLSDAADAIKALQAESAAKDKRIEDLELVNSKLEVELEFANHSICRICNHYYTAIGEDPKCTGCRLREVSERDSEKDDV